MSRSPMIDQQLTRLEAVLLKGLPIVFGVIGFAWFFRWSSEIGGSFLRSLVYGLIAGLGVRGAFSIVADFAEIFITARKSGPGPR